MSTENNGTEEGILGQVAGICEFHLSYLRGCKKKNGSLIPGTSAHFYRLIELSSIPHVTASKQLSFLVNTEENFEDPSRNQLPINFKRLVNLKIT